MHYNSLNHKQMSSENILTSYSIKQYCRLVGQVLKQDQLGWVDLTFERDQNVLALNTDLVFKAISGIYS